MVFVMGIGDAAQKFLHCYCYPQDYLEQLGDGTMYCQLYHLNKMYNLYLLRYNKVGHFKAHTESVLVKCDLYTHLCFLC